MFDFTKRIGRRRYWPLIIAHYAVGVLIVYLFAQYSYTPASSDFELIPDLPLYVAVTMLVFSLLALTRQRANDISERYALALVIVSIVLVGPLIGFLPSEGANRYGTAKSQ